MIADSAAKTIKLAPEINTDGMTIRLDGRVRRGASPDHRKSTRSGM
jgi:hypothetical protein